MPPKYIIHLEVDMGEDKIENIDSLLTSMTNIIMEYAKKEKVLPYLVGRRFIFNVIGICKYFMKSFSLGTFLQNMELAYAEYDEILKTSNSNQGVHKDGEGKAEG